MPLWFASLDLRKAFDRVEWKALFEALNEQGLPEEYQHLLAMLYDNQVGTLGQGQYFPIRRGVRQGDVLSALLFNAASEMVMRRWKSRLDSHGIKLSNDAAVERLTNVRFADDLIIYANSLDELTAMLDLLVQEFHTVGLELNAKKSRIYTLDADVVAYDVPFMVDVADGFVEVVRKGNSHVYLGCQYVGDLRSRGKGLLAGRLQAAWDKFHMFRSSLTNKHVDMKLRINLFESVVLPSALYGLSTAPLTAADFEKLDATQRKMLRLMVGFVKLRTDTREDMYRRIKRRLAKIQEHVTIRCWADELRTRKKMLRQRVTQTSSNCLVKLVQAWNPKSLNDSKLQVQPFRGRGRPRTSWWQHVSADA